MSVRFLFVVVCSVIILAVMLAPLLVSSLSPGPAAPDNSSPSRAAPVDRNGDEVDAPLLISSMPGSSVAQVTSSDGGSAILERHCSRCHVVQSFDQIEKSPAEWEKALAQMEGMGVRLEDPEKATLLDYLAASSQP